ncbi:MAG: FAD:protein FMN transferase [bacterium]
MRIKRIVIVFLILIILSSCAIENRRRKTFLAMGNIPIEVTLYTKDNLDFEKTFDEIESEIKRLDSLFSKHNPMSEVSLFNNSAKGIQASEDIITLVILSDSMKRKTKGYFDIEIETLLSYYKRCEDKQSDLSDDSILLYTGAILKDSVYIKNDSILKSDPVIKIDFGGIAKGYFGDAIVAIMKKNLFKKGIANLGGDISVVNDADDDFFKVGIRSAAGDSVAKVDSIQNGAIVTSGDYFRFYEIKNKKYCHIINPKTGYQADNIHSVTVKALTGFEADAFATAVMLMDSFELDDFKEKNKEVSIYIQK